MTEHDLGLKVGVRRLLWSMGFSTRLDVELRGERIAAKGVGRSNAKDVNRGKGGPETFTDLDVLGVLITSGYRLTTTIADCKTGGANKPTARMFWARGVADLFGADQVMLVPEREVNDATRQLSSRLGITVLPSADLAAMQQLHGPPVADPTGPLQVLFDRKAVAESLSAYTGLDRRLNALLEYREFDYWVYDQYRNPIQLVAHLQDAAEHLNPRHPIHLALFLDLAWLYMVALVRVTEHLRGAFLQDPDRGLQEYLFGGATNLQEKLEVAALLRDAAPEGTPVLDHLPSYYANLRELVTRILRRPGQIQAALRYAEAASALMAVKRRIPLRDAFTVEFDPVAAKLVADVCGFLVAAADLDPAFRVQARAYLLAEPVEGKQVLTRTPGVTGEEPRDPSASSPAPQPGEGATGSVESDDQSKQGQRGGSGRQTTDLSEPTSGP